MMSPTTSKEMIQSEIMELCFVGKVSKIESSIVCRFKRLSRVVEWQKTQHRFIVL